MSEERDDLISAEDAIEDATEEENLEDGLLEEETQEEPEAEEEVESSEEKAKKYGHLSKEEWVAQGKDPNQWKSPEEFNKTGEIIGEIRSLKSEIKRRDRELESVTKYIHGVREREYERAKQDLESRLAASKDDMDMEGVAHYTKELTRLEDQEVQSKQSQVQQSVQDAEQRFAERNQHWFNEKNPHIVQRTYAVAQMLRDSFPEASPDELAQRIETRMQFEFPDRVLQQQKTISQPTVSPSKSAINKTSAKRNSVDRVFNGLSDELKDTYNVIRRMEKSIPGNEEYTKAKFIQKLKEDGEI